MALSAQLATVGLEGVSGFMCKPSTSSYSYRLSVHSVSRSALWGSSLRFSQPPASSQVRMPFVCHVSYAEDEESEEEESEEDVAAAYEALYGKSFAGPLRTQNTGSAADDEEEDKPRRRGRRSDDAGEPRAKRGQPKDGFEERVIQVRRVTKVVKGGKQLAFRAVVVLGDKNGTVGVGVGKAKEVVIAVQKSATDARRHLVKVPMTKYLTFPHRANGHFGAAEVMLRPAAIGTGVIAGGAVRTVLELAGVENALGKELGSGNPLNNARAVLDAVSNMKQFSEVAKARGIPMEDLWK